MKRIIQFVGTDTDLYLAKEIAQAEQLQADTLVIEVTTDRVRTVYLPEYINLLNISLVFQIVDKTGGAGSHKIMIKPTGSTDTINGRIKTEVNTAYGVATVTGVSLTAQPADTHRWACFFGGAADSQNGGGGTGGGGTSDLLTFDQTFSAAEVRALLNDSTTSEEIVAPVESNQIIQIVTQKLLIPEFVSPVYNNDDARLCLVSLAGSNTQLPYGIIPPNFLSQTVFIGVGVDFTPFIDSRPTNQYYSYAGSSVGGGIYLRADKNYSVSAGNSPVRVFGSYYVKTLELT